MKAAIFDLDNTLVITSKISFKIWKNVFRSAGISFTKQDYKSIQGMKIEDAVAKILQGKNLESTILRKRLTALRFKEKEKIYRAATKKDLPEVKGATKFLAALKKNRIKLAVATSTDKASADRIMQMHKMRRYFDAVITAEEIRKSKPDPYVFLLAARRLRVKPKDCIVFEDSASGIVAARNAKMRCVAVAASKTRKELEKEKPYEIIRDFQSAKLEKTLF